ncbi:MAG: D-alanyl-D-alanine carboxypeptidase [Clostridium sp.]|nr:D-alanyl-D-alanine carboxypeptidase [Clostridium sp.]
MKRTLSIVLSLIITIISVATPFSALAASYEPDRKIYAEAYMLINLDDDSYPVVAEKNSEKKLYPASLTKIVTATVVLNHVKDLSAKTKMSQTAYDSILGTGAQVAGIEVGEELTIEELLYLTMVHSACDACQVLAEYVSGSISAFVEEMNKWVASIGCKNTNFVNPDGLHDPNHYTTAQDMATITLEALKNPEFVRISTATEVKFHNIVMGHTNLMLQPGYVTYYYEYAQGIKTGSTEEAEYCVITKASKDGYNYLAVVLKSPQQAINGEPYKTKCSFVDAKSLFEWAFDSLKYTTLVSANEVVGEVNVENGKDADTVQLIAKEDTNVIVPAGLDKSAVIYEMADKPESIEAPVVKGQDVCKANVIYGDEVIATVDLVAANTVELSTFLKIMNALKAFFSSTPVKIILIAAVILAVIYVIIFVNNSKKKKNKRNRASQNNTRRNTRGRSSDRYNNAGSDDFLPPPKPPINR